MAVNVPETDDLIKFDEFSPVKDMKEGKDVNVVDSSNENSILDTPAPPVLKTDCPIEAPSPNPLVPALRKPIPDEQRNNRERNPVTGSGVNMDVRRTRGHAFNPNQGGNPITWEGYAEERPGTPQNTGELGYPSNARKGRVPPGGFSSGLW